MITWRELRKRLQDMPDERLDDTATVYDVTADEYFGVEQFKIAEDDGVLDEGHSIMTCNDNFTERKG